LDDKEGATQASEHVDSIRVRMGRTRLRLASLQAIPLFQRCRNFLPRPVATFDLHGQSVLEAVGNAEHFWRCRREYDAGR
jgi:hypothetical protein